MSDKTTMPTDPTLTEEELDLIARAREHLQGCVGLKEALKALIERHRPKPTLPDTMEVWVYIRSDGKPDVMNLTGDVPATRCTVYPNPERMMDPVTLVCDHGLYIVPFNEGRLSGLKIRSVGDLEIPQEYRGTCYDRLMDGYHEALRKATEIANGRGK